MKKLAGILAGVGAINWLLVGLFEWNLVSFIFRVEWLITVIYVVVGLAGIVVIAHVFGGSKSCDKCDSPEMPKSNDNEGMGEEQM